MATALNPLPGWSPPMSPGGPQNQNVISYGQALGQSLGCDPYTGCPTTIQQPISGQSLQSWLNPIASSASIATNPGMYAPASAPASAPSSAPWYGNYIDCLLHPSVCQETATPAGVLTSGVPSASATPAQGAAQLAAMGGANPTWSTGIVGRIAAFLLGLIGIAGAVYLFKE